MTKKILVMTFFWCTFIGFFYMLLTKSAPPGTTLNITNYKLDITLKYIGIVLFSCIVGLSIGASYDFLTKKVVK